MYELAHDAIDQIYPRGRRTVVRGPRRSEHKVQFVDVETACSDGVEPLPVVLSPRERDRQEISGACEPLLRSPRHSDYMSVAGERWQRVRRLKGILQFTLQLVVLTVVVDILCGKRLHQFLERAMQLL